jgi:hypothetical protein
MTPMNVCADDISDLVFSLLPVYEKTKKISCNISGGFGALQYGSYRGEAVCLSASNPRRCRLLTTSISLRLILDLKESLRAKS